MDVLNLASTPAGIERAVGMCESRPAYGGSDGVEEDEAYKIGSRAVASIPTAQVFPDGFPRDFSVLATFRADQNSKSTLFAVYSDQGELVLSLKIGRRMRMVYKGAEGEKPRKVKFGPNLVDGK